MGVIFSLSVVHMLFKPSTFAATPSDRRERGVWRRRDGPAPTRLAADARGVKSGATGTPSEKILLILAMILAILTNAS